MNELSSSYQSGLAATMLDEGIIRLSQSHNGSVHVNIETDVMGKPESPLWEIAAFGYSMILQESGLMQPEESRPGVITFAQMQPFVSRVLRDLGIDWQPSDKQPTIEEVNMLTPNIPSAIMLDSTLDESSVELARTANRYGQVIGMVALLNMQEQGVVKAIREDAGIQRIYSVIRFEDVVRHLLRTNRGPITQREGITILNHLDPSA